MATLKEKNNISIWSRMPTSGALGGLTIMLLLWTGCGKTSKAPPPHTVINVITNNIINNDHGGVVNINTNANINAGDGNKIIDNDCGCPKAPVRPVRPNNTPKPNRNPVVRVPEPKQEPQPQTEPQPSPEKNFEIKIHRKTTITYGALASKERE